MRSRSTFVVTPKVTSRIPRAIFPEFESQVQVVSCSTSFERHLMYSILPISRGHIGMRTPIELTAIPKYIHLSSDCLGDVCILIENMMFFV